MHAELKKISRSADVKAKIKEGLYETELKDSDIKVGPIASGSAVIADEEKMAEIEDQHRKLLGIEMEIYAMYEAAKQSLILPLFLGVKTVVDIGSEAKGDNLQQAGAIMSARFLTIYLQSKLSSLTES